MTGHTCHAMKCKKPCKPEWLMCWPHWRTVSKDIQRAVWATYRHGQCDDKQPSPEWHKAADAAIYSVAIREGHSGNPHMRRVIGEVVAGNMKPLEKPCLCCAGAP